MIDPVFKIKKAYFTQTKIIRMMDAKTRKALSKYGAYVRRTAQTSMRSRKGSSSPGSPPYAHGQKLLRKHIYFSYDEKAKTVVVGPLLLRRTQEISVPRLHEGGGTITRMIKGKPVTYNYEKRSYMAPAHEKYVGQIIKWYTES